MFRGLLTKAQFIVRRWRTIRSAVAKTPVPVTMAPKSHRLERVTVADGVMQTLFEDYAEHRHTPRGDEEVGWFLLGHRQDNEAFVTAALPAGTERDASVGHVRFDADAQSLASLILRQKDKRLCHLGVVHTHPGDMRYPSSGDLLGDSRWVEQLRSGEAIFGIGTADVQREDAGDANIYGDMCFSWYTLGVGDHRYRPLPIHLTEGIDHAAPLRPLWSTIESHATPLLRLCRQFARVQLDVLDDGLQKLLNVKIPLAQHNQQLRLLLTDTQARYYLERQGNLIAIDPHEAALDRAVYLILAELAKDSAQPSNDSRLLAVS